MSLALGAHAFGSEPLAGDLLRDPVSVSAVSLGVVTTGGPVLSLEWVYTQAQGEPQEQYRVRLMNDALTETYYDSGLLFGSDQVHEVDMDENEIPANTDDITFQIDVMGPESVGHGVESRSQASDTDAFEIAWGDPQATIIKPLNGQIVSTASGLDVEWSFSDDEGKTQGAYRVRAILKDTGLTLFDSGWVESSATTFDLPVVLQDQWTYQVEVQLKNNHGLRSE